MRRLGLLMSLLLIGSPAAAAPDWRQAREVDLLLSSFDVKPETITLKAGQPVRLRFINQSEQSHTISVGSLFRTAETRNRDSALTKDGVVRLGPGETREIALVPKAGRYKASSNNWFYRLMGMSGRIVVE